MKDERCLTRHDLALWIQQQDIDLRVLQILGIAPMVLLQGIAPISSKVGVWIVLA